MDISFERNGIFVDIGVDGDGRVALWNCSAEELRRGSESKWYPIAEVQCTGCNHNNHHGSKHCITSPGAELRYEAHGFARNAQGDLFTISLKTSELRATVCMQFYDGVKALRAYTILENIGDSVLPLEHVSSFRLTGIGHGENGQDSRYVIGIPHSTWFGECQWRFSTLRELGYNAVNDFSVKRIALSSTGSWAASEHLPMGSMSQPGHTMTWQLETSASWMWELSDLNGQLYLQLSGPSWQEHQFLKRLKPGERFESIPCALAYGGDFDESIGELTKYRRRIRRPNADNEHPSVIFNDYMNCLWGDPTTEKEYPLIDAAAAAGCKYYCIDCGWYDDGPWWDGVGEWFPAKGRFPGGIEELLDYIRKKDMIPGLWLELEVMGIGCSLASKVPDDWFFCVEGRRVIDESRYQLDFRNPEVIRHADEVIDRLVCKYGVGYIKMDYNINAGPGTQHNADSAGHGLFEHTRAYLRWLDKVFERYPELVIENCSSGGMRMEYSHLSRYSIQSVTDQTDYIKMASIACNCMTACAPEQAAIWSYPMREGDDEEAIFNMVNAMLLRIHQSGHLAELSPERLRLVREGIRLHMSVVEESKDGLPFWPIGLGSFDDEWLCTGIRCKESSYLAVWHTAKGAGFRRIPLKGFIRVECVYPTDRATDFDFENETLNIALDGVKARLFKLERL